MTHFTQFISYKNHLQRRYNKLIEKSASYRFIDESESDVAAYKAMKISQKLNQMRYLDKELSNSFS